VITRILLTATLIASLICTRGIAANAPDSAPEACGLDIRARDVIVIDLRRLVNDPEKAQALVHEQVGDYRLAHPLIDEFRTAYRPSGDPDAVIRGARKLGEKKGCDLVMVLASGPYLGRQRSRKATPKDGGYVMVSMGQIIDPDN
jgi:hypothetical protein